MFDKISIPGHDKQYFSYVGLNRQYSNVPAEGTIPSLIRDCYKYSHAVDNDGNQLSSERKNRGFIGSLPILIGLAAFTQPHGDLVNCLANSLAPNMWIRQAKTGERSKSEVTFRFSCGSSIS